MTTDYEIITGIKHPAYRDAIALLKTSTRTETGRYLAEDTDMTAQALRANIAIAVYCLADTAAQFSDDCARQNVPLYLLSNSLITRLIGTGYETAVTALAIVRQKTTTTDYLIADPSALILAAERIQDPRNVGVLIRTAEAAGCTGLVLSADSADAYSRAAVRSTTGSVFRLPILIAANLPHTMSELKAKGATIIATSARASAIAYQTDLARRPLVLAVGNESDGISTDLRQASDALIALPMPPNGASSLNVTVAAGALLFECMRQRQMS